MSKTPGGKDTPSEFIALHKDIEWNPNGLNYFNRDLSKPIIHVSDEKTIQQVSYDDYLFNSYLTKPIPISKSHIHI